VDITQADILVAVGRGIKDAENIPLIKELVDALGGVLACSRPVVDKNWLPKSCQVGTSGKTVKPKVYIALGISGAFQHIAGMKGAERSLRSTKTRRRLFLARPIMESWQTSSKSSLFLKDKVRELRNKN